MPRLHAAHTVYITRCDRSMETHQPLPGITVGDIGPKVWTARESVRGCVCVWVCVREREGARNRGRVRRCLVLVLKLAGSHSLALRPSTMASCS